MEVRLIVVICAALLVTAVSHKYDNPLAHIRYDKITVRSESVTVGVIPTQLNASRTWAVVYVSGVESPSNDDWIGLFALPDGESTINANKHAPVKFKNASVADGYLKKGAAEFYFNLINLRQDLMFGFFRGGFQAPVLVSTSNRVINMNPNQPVQGHIALTEDPTTMLLQWVTKNATDAEVQWGTASGKYSQSNKASGTTYKADDMCASPAIDYGWMEPGTIHTATMENLVPSIRYYYRFGSPTFGWSKEFSFKAPPVTSPHSAVKIIAYGDLGHGQIDGSMQVKKLEQNSLYTTQHVSAEVNKTDLIVHIGDLSYADGFAAQWDEYYTEVESVAANAPYMVSPGNHESDSPNSTAYFMENQSGGECNIPYMIRNAMPRPTKDKLWYGFDFGCVHFVMMDTEQNFTNGSEQHTFLMQHLAAVNRTLTPWLIFTGHRPMYVDSTQVNQPDGMQPVAKLMRDNLEYLLKEFNVDIAFWGHHHTYQRTCPVYQSVCTSNGIPHVIIGMAGRELLPDFEQTPPDYFDVLDDKHYGFTRLSVNATTLVFQYVWNDDLTIHDTVILTK